MVGRLPGLRVGGELAGVRLLLPAKQGLLELDAFDAALDKRVDATLVAVGYTAGDAVTAEVRDATGAKLDLRVTAARKYDEAQATMRAMLDANVLSSAKRATAPSLAQRGSHARA